jgi:hypothetical protein
MEKRKKTNRKSQQRTQVSRTTTINNVHKPLRKRINGVVLWLAATGFLTVIGSFTFDFLTGDVQVQYIKPSGRGYEFKLVNNSSTDQVVEQFRISPDFGQGLLFKINQSVYGEFTENGVTIPGGNSTYMPAFEYKEMNGYVLQAKSEVNFRVPPLVSRDYMVPESIVVFADYSTKSNNRYMAKLESILAFLHLRDAKKSKKYLVVDNYWTPLGSGSEVNAIKNACRDDDLFAKSTICRS